MSSMIKAICFDLDGVYFTPEGKASFHTALTEEFGGDPEAVNAFMYGSETMQKFVTGNMSGEDFWEALRAQTGITATDTELTGRWIKDYVIDERVRAAVLSAREQGYITCVCTNNNAVRLPALEAKFHFMSDFDHIVSSHQTGFMKPSKEMFQTLLDTVGVEPAELVYSDDNPERLQGATDLGITTFVYENFEQFLRELKKLGINL